MEIYRGAPEPVTIAVPAEVKNLVSEVDVFALENGRAFYEFPTVENTVTGYSVTLPWALHRQDRDFQVEWKITYTDAGQSLLYVEQSQVQIVTPILDREEVARIAGFDLTTEAGRNDTLDLERRVRYAIQTHTGQNFGRFTGTMQVSGNGSDKLNLPAPLLEFKGMAYDGILRSNHGVRLINNGWAIAGTTVYIDNIKQAPPEWMLDRFDYTGKISAPLLYGQNRFVDGVEYTVEGVWGYHDVPGDVRQAARLLTDQYSHDESLWRETYIDSVRAGDWRFEFNAQAFAGTGNVQADQILDGYRRATMVVV